MNTHTTGVLFRDSFGTPEMRAAVSEAAFVERFLEAEAALARAEARAGIVPEAAAEEITRKATLEHVDLDEVAANVEEMGLFTVAIIDAWKDAFDGAGEYVHWGATSQDVSDMAMLLQLREAHELLRSELREIEELLVDLAERHADTPMIGRTHYVHATPITFGLKAATWLDEVHRGRRRLEALADRLFVVQFFGATGTLASLEGDGEAVQRYLAEELDMSVPDVAWFVLRDRFAEFANALAMLASTFGRIADQVLASNRPELDELCEPIPDGEIGSSTMPHKRNPFRSETTSGLARLVRAHASTMTDLMDGLDERDMSTWLMEFAVLPETCLYTARILANSREVLADLGVDADAMRENLHEFSALVTSEAVMMRLAGEVGRQTAHEIVHENAMTAVREDRDFRDLLAADDRVAAHLTPAELADLTEPESYTGDAERFVERTVATVRDGWE